MSPYRPVSLLFLISLSLPLLLSNLPPAFSAAPDPDPAIVQPLHVNPSPPATIPAFPEQSDVAGCPLDLPGELFRGVKSACGAGRAHGGEWGELHRSRCCPVLAAWLYSAYSATALGRAAGAAAPPSTASTTAYDMPLLPDDSETCVDDLGKAFKERGMELAKPNETCDVVYCYCGIRLRPLSCPEAFSVSATTTKKTQKSGLVGNDNVRRLERDCLSSGDSNGFPGLGGCSRCLNSLNLLNKNTSDSSKLEDSRTTKMHNKDCQLMGLTWLLAKNRSAYIHTVSAVLRAIMMSADGSTSPQSCTLNSDGMPLAVDSSEISDSSSPCALPAPFFGLLVASLAVWSVYLHLATSV